MHAGARRDDNTRTGGLGTRRSDEGAEVLIFHLLAAPVRVAAHPVRHEFIRAPSARRRLGLPGHPARYCGRGLGDPTATIGVGLDRSVELAAFALGATPTPARGKDCWGRPRQPAPAIGAFLQDSRKQLNVTRSGGGRALRATLADTAGGPAHTS
jgi:hypothetical protein